MPADLVIDAHMHFWDVTWLPEGLRLAWARQGAGRRYPERDPLDILPRVATGESDPDAALTISAFDRAGVAAGLVPVVDWTIVGAPAGEHLPIGALNARYEAVCTAHEGRLFFAAGIDPRHPDARELFEQSVAHPHCRGVKLYPAAGWDLRDPAHDWLFRELVERELTAVIHCSPLGGDPLQVIRSRPAEVAALLAQHPTLRVSFAHAGIEAWWAEALDCATGWQHAYLELSLWQRVGERDYGELRHRVALMRDQLGAHRLVFGSDIVRGTKHDPDGAELQRWVDMVRDLAAPYAGTPAVLSEEEMGLFLSDNAIRLFDLKEFA
ncbi:amidohydrolase family protein [Microbacterium rhizomatis]|uniref:Amidohydrolase n=1 Tax=Microbacterium rhizomatis TaxID=1631477 RepID=A0A5J5J1I1_9MICO|nr:amidohydrolase family protein [Microbacterium rhizomatis]KAA9108217.1 amidohydrolase [Microbacterium rhizomatis]